MPVNKNNRRPDNGSPDAAITASLLATSNATFNMFLGGKRKSWMAGGDPLSPPLRTPRPPAVPTELLSGSASRPRAGVSIPLVSPREASSTSTSPPLANQDSRKDVPRKETVVSSNTLPSPAPSDDHPSEEAAVIVVDYGDEDAEPRVSSSARTRKRATEATQPQKHPRTDPLGTRNGVQSRSVQQPPVLRSSALSDSAYQPQLPDQSRTEMHPSPMSPPLPPPRRLGLSQNASSHQQPSSTGVPSNQLPAAYQQQDRGPAQEVRQPVHLSYHLPRCVELLRNFISHAGPMPLGSSLAGRLQLLREAIALGDYSYLTLHQILCLATVARHRVPHSINRLPNLPGALAVLEGLLAPNSHINPSALDWCANFPTSIEHIAQHWPALYHQQVSHLQRLTLLLESHWHAFHKHCKNRGYPPLVRELADHLGVISSVLQHVIFTAIMRNSFGINDSEFFRSADRIFREDQQAHQLCVAREDQHYIHQYRQLYALFGQVQVNDASRLQMVSGPLGSLSLEQPRNVGTWNRQGSSTYLSQAQHGQAQHGQAQHSQPARSLESLQTPQLSGPSIAQTPQTSPIVRQHQQSQMASHTPSPLGPTSSLAAANQPQPLGPLIPRAGYTLPQPANPDPTASALHQAHLRSPDLGLVDHSVPTHPAKSLYRHVMGFALKPKPLDRSVPLQSWSFTVSNEEFSRIPETQVSSLGAPPLWQVRAGSQMYRLRCAKLSEDLSVPDEQTWVVADNVWPMFVYLHVNGAYCEFRRKPHYGRDLPLDVTPYVREGDNTIEVFSNLKSDDVATPVNYAFAVEVVGVMTEEEIVGGCPIVPVEDVLDSIKSSLASGDTDDDVAVVSSNLSIKLFDPFSGCKIFDVPARGRSCRHRDCFDLETFLQTRRRRRPGWASEVDDWRCPICKGDVRPQSLVVDGFLLEVRIKLAERGLLNTRTIVVEQDGSWKPKMERIERRYNSATPKHQSLAAEARPSSTLTPHSIAIPPTAEVIDLGDEDDQ